MSKFLDAKAPMTAKCIIRDAINKKYWQGGGDDVAVKIIEELAHYNYIITSVPEADPTTPRRRQKRIAP